MELNFVTSACTVFFSTLRISLPKLAITLLLFLLTLYRAAVVLSSIAHFNEIRVGSPVPGAPYHPCLAHLFGLRLSHRSCLYIFIISLQ